MFYFFSTDYFIKEIEVIFFCMPIELQKHLWKFGRTTPVEIAVHGNTSQKVKCFHCHFESVCQYTCVSITLLVYIYIYIYIYNFIITLLSNEVTQMKKLFSRTRTRTRTITARAKSSLLQLVHKGIWLMRHYLIINNAQICVTQLTSKQRQLVNISSGFPPIVYVRII